MQTNKELVKHLLTMQQTGVLATQSTMYPYTSLVAFLVSDECDSLFFITSKNTKKFDNLQTNDHVCFFIDDRKNNPSDFIKTTTLTIIGTATEVDKHLYTNKFLQKHPQLTTFIKESEITMIKIHINEMILVRNFQEVHRLKPKDLSDVVEQA